MSTQKEILFYTKVNGDCPVQEFLDSLRPKTAQKMTWILNLAEDLERVPSHYFCKLAGTDNLWEFRMKWESNIYRIFAFLDGHRIVLTHGFH